MLNGALCVWAEKSAKERLKENRFGIVKNATMNGSWLEGEIDLMIAPTYYRSHLNPIEQDAYMEVVNGILHFDKPIYINTVALNAAAVSRVVKAVHNDHPELFWINYWDKYRVVRNSLLHRTALQFSDSLVDKKTALSIRNTLNEKACTLRKKVQAGMSTEQRYYMIMNEVASNTKYVDSKDAFWNHTAAGPVLRHTAVCEGISKLFLYYCHYLNMPCAMITGTIKGAPHAWNMVETTKGIQYIDVTSLLGTTLLCRMFPDAMFKTRKQLLQRGYVWSQPDGICNGK